MSIPEQLMAWEVEHCRCVVEQNFQRVAELLSPSLIHTHTRSNVDSYKSGLALDGPRRFGAVHATLLVSAPCAVPR
jgi:hypothetical protein